MSLRAIEGNDRLDRGGGQAVRVDCTSRDMVRCARAEQQLLQLPAHIAGE